MCLGVFPGGNGEGRGTHVSLFVHLMRGDNDSELKWPFRGSVVVELLNQQADHTHYRLDCAVIAHVIQFKIFSVLNEAWNNCGGVLQDSYCAP